MSENTDYPSDAYEHLTSEQMAVGDIDSDTQYQEKEVFAFKGGSVQVAEYERWDDESRALVKTNEPRGGFHLHVGEVAHPPIPGRRIRYYGKGFGYAVRGVSVEDEAGNWHVIRYNTPREQAEQDHDDHLKYLRENEERYHREKDDRGRRIAELPKLLKERIRYFRVKSDRCDGRFMYDSEPYELFIYEQAAIFAEICPTVKELELFREAAWETQKELVKSKKGEKAADEFSGHSGNTFSGATAIARALLVEPEKLEPPRNDDGSYQFEDEAEETPSRVRAAMSKEDFARGFAAGRLPG